ncbi:AraC family transcriptional regulator [Saccharothrix coeruleofusca]|uniref:AraC family transcriptional regulator n=1 Tax=Saccharothrix coeruleofusca TaxID=33919 RepID=A0A918ECL9_9PSEU|nr:AraC family transcriptional regulator [Saccharothrix coeruleofusca]GGP49983.1 AraC family transcriptional regulator [Saccharothrix coeruleofusca]
MAGTLESIRSLIAKHAVESDPRLSPGGIRLHLSRSPSAPVPIVFEPMLYLVFQGRKQIVLDDWIIDYGSEDLVITYLDLPALTRVTEADQTRPYMAVELPLDLDVLVDLATDMRLPPVAEARAVSVRPLPEAVLDPVLRLLKLLGSPMDAKILADGLKREITYRVLTSPQGDSLLQLINVEGVARRIRSSTEWMRHHVDAPVDVGTLANRAGMSVTSFHRHFKAATGTTPVEYHKRVRLHEARRLLTGEVETVSRIATAVGYASPSQFSRDYKRMFGTPPAADPLRLRPPRERSG